MNCGCICDSYKLGKSNFPEFPKKLMSGLDWGIYYNKYGSAAYDPKALETRIVELIKDYQNNYILRTKKGFMSICLMGRKTFEYPSIFTRNSRVSFTEQQNGICRSVVNILNLKKCKRTTSRHGVKSGKTTPITVKCSVRIVTEEKSNILLFKEKSRCPRIHIGCICFFYTKTAGISAVVPLRMVMLFNTISQIFICKALFSRFPAQSPHAILSSDG